MPQSVAGSDDLGHSEVEESLEPVPLTPELAANIIRQVEFYFSDANLATDKKLLKTVKKSPNGFVPVKLFTNFRKVRALTKDADTIAAALQGSQLLQLSDDSLKVRRLAEIPQYDVDDIQRRTIVVERLPSMPTIESVTDKFSAYGKVNLVRICTKESKGKLPHWLTATTQSISSQQHAFVEFCDADAAVMAVAALHDGDEWGGTMTARHLLIAPSDKDGYIAPMTVRRGLPTRSDSQASIGSPLGPSVRRNLPTRSDSQASIGSPSFRRGPPSRSDSQASIGSLFAPPVRLAQRLLEKSISERCHDRSLSSPLDLPGSPLRSNAATSFSGPSAMDAVAPGTPTSTAAAQAALLGLDRNMLKERILNDVDGFVDQLLSCGSLTASPRVSHNGAAMADLPPRVTGLTISCPKPPAAAAIRSAPHLGDVILNRSALSSAASLPVREVACTESGSPREGLWSRRAAGSPHPSLTPSRWQSYDEDLTTMLADKGDSTPGSPCGVGNSGGHSSGRNRLLHNVALECPATVRRQHMSDGGAARGVSHDRAQETATHARLQEMRMPGSPGSPGSKLARGGKKDYASWAAATPEYRTSMTVPPKRMSRSGLEGAFAVAAAPPALAEQLVHIARGPDGSAGFRARVRTPQVSE